MDQKESALTAAFRGFVDTEWYRDRYPDILTSGLDPIVHFIRHGLAERRDPNPFFDCTWYVEHYPDVGASGMHPLIHYMQAGAAELRNPHPDFDAVYYADRYPDAAANPLLFHIRVGWAQGYLTEKPIEIQDYLPSTHKSPRVPARLRVDIVIPVYRGLAETRQCLDAVLADPSRPQGRVIIIDDCSPDAELSRWLQQVSAKGQITLLRNPRNLGFVASVNRGMEAAGNHDVVLLNSDTEVPDGWVARLAAQAYASPRIATVSPLSNNATICSYPGNQGGPLPPGLALRDIDDICRTVNTGRWVDAPTTVGFCMYIRRKALQEVGVFDAERFGFGYGEENDFCLRASALGWQHRIACDTFVYHAGSVSFGNRAARLMTRAMKLIEERHPDYQRDIARHVGLGKIDPGRFAITAALLRRSGLPVIVMITHDLGGGVRRHIDALIERFKQNAWFLLLEATDRGATLSVPSLPGHPVLTLPAKRMELLIELLRSMNVSRIHIHHLLGMDMDIRALVHRLDVPFDVTVHDYYAICPQINLLPWPHDLYCGEPDIAACNSCIANRSSHNARDIVTWRTERSWQFHEAARVFCPSRDVLKRLGNYGLDKNAVLAPHEAVAARPWPCKAVGPVVGRMRIAVLGTLVDHKGARTVASVLGLADPKAIEIHLIGHVEEPFPEYALKRMRITGKYDDADLAGLIAAAAPHLIWFPAVCPETFSYTLSAAIESGIPIAATRIGANSERLAGRPNTWLVDITTTPAAWVELFGEVRAGLAEHQPVRSIPVRPAVKDVYASGYLRPVRRQSRSSGPRIVVVPERYDAGFPTPCAYIRLLQPLSHPSSTSGFDVSLTDANGALDHQADIIITQRHAIPDTETADRLATHARQSGAALVFDLDDDLLNIPRSHADAALLRPRAKVVRRMLDLADQVWVSTPGLAKRLQPVRTDVVVMENRLDERIWTPSCGPPDDHPIRILCMGTATHDQDFALIEPSLMRLKSEYADRIVIDVIGVTPRTELPRGVNRISPSVNASRSYPGFVNWLSSVQPGWHIGLAPLLDTPFNNCKSAIKTMDYAALGMAVLASDTPVYRGSIADGQAGQLVRNDAASWYAALDRLVRDRDTRRTMGEQARCAFLAGASLASHGEIRQAAWAALLRNRHRDAA